MNAEGANASAAGDSRREWLAGTLLVLGLTALYASTCPTALPDGDAGEFLTIARFGGIAHPPGYPLYCAIIRAVAGLSPPLPLVPLVALVSIGSAVVAAWISYRALAVIIDDAALRLVAVACVFLAPPVWRIATAVEPFALNLPLISILLYVALKSSYQPQDGLAPRQVLRYGAAIGASFGLGLCNHHTLVLFAPLTLPFWAAVRQRGRRGPAAVAMVTAFIAALLPLAYFALDRSAAPLSWGDWSHFAGELKRHLLRENYGTLKLMGGKQGSWGESWRFWRDLPATLGIGPLVTSAAGLCLVLAAPRKLAGASSRLLLGVAITLTVAAVGVGFLGRFPVPQSALEHAIVGRFHHLPLIALLPVLAGAFAATPSGAPRHVLVLLLVACQVAHTAQHWRQVDRRQETFNETDVLNVFVSLAPGDVVLPSTDAEYLGLIYGQSVLGLGQGVHIITPSIWGTAWYRRKVCASLAIQNDCADSPWKTLLHHLVATRRVFTTLLDEDVEGAGIPVPEGRLIRLLAPDGQGPGFADVVARNERLLTQIYAWPKDASKLSDWESMAYGRYLRALALWRTLATMLPARAQAPSAPVSMPPR